MINNKLKKIFVAIFLCLFGAFLVLLLNKVPVTLPLTIDEALTAWLISLDFSSITKEVFYNQGTSALYFYLLKIYSLLIGSHEPTQLKLFSYLLLIGSAVFIYKILRLYFAVAISVTALIVLFSLNTDFVVNIIPIRSYSFVCFCLALASYQYFKYLKNIESQNSNKIFLTLSFCLLYLATITHYYFLLFWILTLCHYLIVSTNKKERQSVITLNVILLSSLIIFIPHFLQIISSSEAWGQSIQSNQNFGLVFSRIISSFKLSFSILIALGLVCIFEARRKSISTVSQVLNDLRNNQALNYALVIFIIPPLTYLLAKELLGIQTFVYRYFFWHSFAGAMLIAFVISNIAKKQQLIALLLCIFITLEIFHWNYKNQYRVPDYRAAADAINQLNQPNLPVLFHPGLVELYDSKMFFDPKKQSYFHAYLAVYPIKNKRIYLLPPELDQQDFLKYFNTRIAKAVQKHREFIVFSSTIPVSQAAPTFAIPQFYINLFRHNGWQYKILNKDPKVAVIKFYKQ